MKGRTIEEIILFVFGEERLQEIRNIKYLDNFTLFYEDHEFLTSEVLKMQCLYSFSAMGTHYIKIHLNKCVYFYCDQHHACVSEDA
jgi:hypothetical protein